MNNRQPGHTSCIRSKGTAKAQWDREVIEYGSLSLYRSEAIDEMPEISPTTCWIARHFRQCRLAFFWWSNYHDKDVWNAAVKGVVPTNKSGKGAPRVLENHNDSVTTEAYPSGTFIALLI